MSVRVRVRAGMGGGASCCCQPGGAAVGVAVGVVVGVVVGSGVVVVAIAIASATAASVAESFYVLVKVGLPYHHVVIRTARREIITVW